MLDLNNVPAYEPARYDPDALARGLAACAEHWVPDLFPAGKRDGPDLRLANIQGDAPRKNGSCVIHLRGPHAGEWYDHSLGRGGSPLSTLQEATGLEWHEVCARAVEIIERHGGYTGAPPARVTRTPDDHRAEVAFILSRTQPAPGTLVETYFAARKLDLPPSDDLLYHDNLTHWETKMGRPAIVAVARYPDGYKSGGIHRIYLRDDGTGHIGKKMLGPIDGAVIMLTPIAEDGVLAMGEGIETTAAGMQLFGIASGWAAMSTDGMRKFGQWLAAHPGQLPIKRLVILADKGEGGEKAAADLQRYAQHAGIPAEIRLPRGGDDFADDLMRGLLPEAAPAGLPPESIAAAKAEHATAAEVIDTAAPYDIAKQFIMHRFTVSGVRTLHHHRGGFYAWAGAAYADMGDAALRAGLYEFLAACKRRDPKGELQPVKPNAGMVNNVLDGLHAAAHLDDALSAPAWLDQAPDLPADEILVCANGLLHLPTLDLLPHTPSFFSHNSLDFAFERNAPEPRQWLAFLAQLWPSDPVAIETLQEMFGLALTGDTRHQKAFLIVGPKRSGKGTIARVLARMVGADNTVAPTLAGLGMNFGLAPLIGKRLAIISDARLGGRADQAAIAERLLSITGEDAITIDRKFLAAWTGRLQVRFLILSNELPRLADTSGALASRFIVLTLAQSFYGKEDRGLADRLFAELPGILNWAIAGWRRLNERGHFRQPDSAAEAVRELEDLGSPIGAFLRERCEIGAGFQATADDLFKTWRWWCESQGRDKPGNAQSFGRDLRAAEPRLKMSRPRTGDEGRKRVYEGIRIRPIQIPKPSVGLDLNDAGPQWSANEISLVRNDPTSNALL
ncbi:MAG TPA: phage/plasmid primase, P4 family [Stellaceae bacterium]|nr:phage/plasmid primase, P4 family [Stellaceae bacterium]